jgi:hypothetical protein
LLFTVVNMLSIFRKVTFTLCVDGDAFVRDIEGLNRAICAFLYVSFIADLEYPQVRYHSGFFLY